MESHQEKQKKNTEGKANVDESPEELSKSVDNVRSDRRMEETDVPSTSQDSISLRQAVALRLRNLEFVNRKLNAEKSQLEHQLLHVLERLATGQVPGMSDREQAMTKNEAREFISTLMCRSPTDSIPIEGKSVPTVAPLAEPDYSGLRDSLVESNSVVSGFDYSSLSDAYEELCLRQDPVQKMVQSESSNFSFRGEPTKMVSPTSQSTEKALSGDIQIFREQSSPAPKKKNSATLASFSTSSRFMERQHFSNLRYEPPVEPKAEGVTLPPIAFDGKESIPQQLVTPETETNAKTTVFPSPDDRIEVPAWLARDSQASSLSLMNVSAKFRGYDTESVQSSSRSCSMFSSSTSSRSSSPVLPVLPPFIKQIMPMTKSQLSSSMPTSPLWPTSAHRKDRRTRGQRTDHSPDARYPTLSPDERHLIGAHGSLHGLQSTGGHIPTRQELITSMRQMYGLPTGDGVTQRECTDRSVPKRSTSERVPILETSKVSSTGPPKVRISRRHIQQPVALEESSDTTSTASRANHLEYTGPKTGTKLPRLRDGLPSASPTGLFERPVTPVIRSRLMEMTSPITRIEVPELYSPQPRWRHQTQMGHSTDFLNVFAEFGQLLPSDASSLVGPSDSTILTYISKLTSGLDAYTCSQGRAVLLQRVQPPFTSITPILVSQEVVCHSHESSDLTSELSSNARRPLNGDQIKLIPLGPDVKSQPGPSHSSEPTTSKPSIFDSPSKLPGPTVESMESFPHMPGSQPDETRGATSVSGDRIIMHQALLFRLSNRVKIWRRYWAVLNPSNLLLHTSQQPSIQAPKRCILLSDIQSIRKPHNLSASITTGMVNSSILEQDRHGVVIKYRNGSVPVTRKLAQLHQDNLGRTNYGHFELILNSGKTHRLRGPNAAETEVWMRQIKRMLRAVRAREVVRNHEAQLVTQGWLQRIKGGEVSWVWCRLMGFYLVYAQSPDSLEPTGFKSLEGTQIKTLSSLYSNPVIARGSAHQTELKLDEDTSQPICSTEIPATLSSSSDSDTLATSDSDVRNRTIALWTEKADPVYLICRTGDEFKQWRDNLIRACHQVNLSVIDRSPDPVEAQIHLKDYWRMLVRPPYTNDPYHTNEMIKQPLSKTTEGKQVQDCLKMFASLLFLSYPELENIQTAAKLTLSNLLGLSEWLTIKHLIVKHLASLCFSMPGLKDELFLQLIKQAMLSDVQTKRLIRRQFPVSPRSGRPRLPLFCARLRSVDESSARRKPREISNPLQSGSRRSEFRIPSDRSAQLGELSKMLALDAHLVFPVPSFIGLIRPEGWWPLVAVWECLCLLLPLFLPSPPVLHCLELLISIYHDFDGPIRDGTTGGGLNAELARYAAFCRDALTQTLRLGGRVEVPSALEVASISIRNPYTHSYPFSIPIYLPSGGVYEVISFNGGSEFAYVIQQIVRKLGLTVCMQQSSCLFAIYLRVNHVDKPPKYLYLRPDWKVCDVISLYEQAVLVLNQQEHRKVRLEDATVELVFRIQAFVWKRLKRLQANEVKSLISMLAHQLHSDLLCGAYQVLPTGSELLDLAAYLCRTDHFDYSTLQRQREMDLNQLVHTYFPTQWLQSLAADNRSFIQLKLLLLDRWGWLCQHPIEPQPMYETKSKSESKTETVMTTSVVHACFSYLRALRNLASTRFGTTAFASHVFNLPGHVESQLVWLVPQETHINVLVSSASTMHLTGELNRSQSVQNRTQRSLICIKSIPYNAVLSFGGQRSGAFFLVYVDRLPHAKRGAKLPVITNGAPTTNSVSHRDAFVISNHMTRHERVLRSGRMKEETWLRKLRIHLTDLNAVQELTDTLVYFMNLT